MVAQTKPSRYRLERITEQHDVSSFDCQNTYLEWYLKEKALEETNRDLARTFVLIDQATSPNPPVIGYFTLRSDSYYLASEGHQGSKIVPVVELVCLARHSSVRSQRIGDYLLIESLRKVADAAELIGIAGMHLSYTSEGKRLYDRYRFGQHPSYGEHLLFLSIANIRQIIAEADKESS
jgi:hypothetical protein